MIEFEKAVVIIYYIFMMVGILLMLNSISGKNDDDGDDKLHIFVKNCLITILIVGMSIAINSYYIRHVVEAPEIVTIDELSVEKYCEDNYISYELVEATADHISGMTEDNIAKMFYVASRNGIEPYDAISMIDPDLSDYEINEILTESDNLSN